jgi:rhomboid protease GluP
MAAIVCPQCGKLISVDEPKCPFCGVWRPGLYGWTPKLQQLFGKRVDLIPLTIGTCIVLYVAALLLEPEAITQPSGIMSLLSPGGRALYQLGMTGGAAWALGWWWTLFTAILLHGSALHILFNVMWIRDLGPSVVDIYGPARAFVIFELAGAIGFLLSNLATGAPSIGASGSIFGLLAALLVYSRQHSSSMMSTQVWQWAIVLFVMGFLLPGVNNWAHGGGFVGGWVAATVLGNSDTRREGNVMVLSALALILINVAGIILSFTKVSTAFLSSQ